MKEKLMELEQQINILRNEKQKLEVHVESETKRLKDEKELECDKFKEKIKMKIEENEILEKDKKSIIDQINRLSNKEEKSKKLIKELTENNFNLNKIKNELQQNSNELLEKMTRQDNEQIHLLNMKTVKHKDEINKYKNEIEIKEKEISEKILQINSLEEKLEKSSFPNTRSEKDIEINSTFIMNPLNQMIVRLREENDKMRKDLTQHIQDNILLKDRISQLTVIDSDDIVEICKLRKEGIYPRNDRLYCAFCDMFDFHSTVNCPGENGKEITTDSVVEQSERFKEIVCTGCGIQGCHLIENCPFTDIIKS
ncbi:hypothetical protein SNEBB_003773 [Seison nebaliae]|nr:hypothetical protein SNEBB_003773 [Seison nebaliae]